MTHELLNPLDSLSFMQSMFESSGFSDLSIVVIPKELAEYSLEQIKGLIGIVSSYFTNS